jgi:hypothetical protein
MSEVNTGTLKSRVVELVEDHAKLAPPMQPINHDADKYDTYLDQLGVVYPTLECPS